MTEGEVIRRAAELARKEGSQTIKSTHLRRAEKQLDQTVEVKS